MSFPPGPSSNRQDLMQNAILFLNDPKVQSSTLTSRITFLESKGLNEHEIQEALRQASSAQTSSFEPSSAPPPPPGVPSHGRSAYGYGQVQGLRPEPPKRDWRDLFVSPPLTPPLDSLDSDGANEADHGGRLWRCDVWPHRTRPSTLPSPITLIPLITVV